MLWNTLFALFLLGVVKYGDYITEECPLRSYTCPTACDVDHKHYPRKECKDAKRQGNIWKESRKAQEERQEKKIEESNGKSKEESRSGTTTV